MKNILFILFSSIALTSLACQCPELPALDKKSYSSYELVFYGEVLSAEECFSGYKKITFQVSELYKGDLSKSQVIVNFACGQDACFADFLAGEQWLLYCNKNNAQDFVLDFCSHSRKLASEGQIDYQEELRGSSFFEDKNYLATTFEVKSINENDLKPRKYEKVDDKLIPVFLGTSLVFMVIGILVFRKKKKK